MLHPKIESVTAFAPATSANLSVGFDILGFALDAPGDEVTLIKRNDDRVVIESIDSEETLSQEAHLNTASLVIQKAMAGLSLKHGFSLRIKKGIPLSSGMGGSAASAVAALVALNAFLIKPLSLLELAHYALMGEALASGEAHADNIVPCLFGGLTLIQSTDPLTVIRLPIPDVYTVLIHPHLYVTTKEARNILKKEISLKDHVKQSAALAGFIAGLYTNDLNLLKQSLKDHLIEKQRAHLVPGFFHIQKAALELGALTASFSGSGPSLFAWANNIEDAKKIAQAMGTLFHAEGLAYDQWISNISKNAAFVKQISEI